MEEEAETIPTGFPDLDEALGIGGLPCGRISELFGADSSGKQALAAAIAVQCQKQEGVVAWIDPAGRLDPEQTRALGVSSDALLVARPRNDLEALEMAVRLARSGGVRLLMFDLVGDRRWGVGDEGGIEASAGYAMATTSSVGRAACPPPGRGVAGRVAADRPGGETRPLRFVQPIAVVGGTGAAGDEPPALRTEAITITRAGHRAPTYSAALTPTLSLNPSLPRSLTPSLNLALRRLVAAVHKNRIAFLFIADSPTTHHSALRTQDPTHHSSPITHHSKGGQALRYFASVRLEIQRREWIRRGKEVVGCRSAVRVVKNKLAAPHREAEVELWFYRFPPEKPAVATFKK